MKNKDESPKYKPATENEETVPDAVYYFCPHCRESHEPDEEDKNRGEIRCPICGEVYEE